LKTLGSQGHNASGPGSATDSDFVQFDGTSGTLLKDGGLSLDTAGTLVANSDLRIASQKAVKTYADTKLAQAGTITNDNAAAGNIGEYIESVIASGSGLALTSNVAKNVTSISLTAGDWDVFGFAGLIGVAGTTFQFAFGGASTTSATLSGDEFFGYGEGTFTLNSNTIQFPFPTKRFSLASTTTIFLVFQGVFAGSTAKCFGRISARRMR